MQKASSKKNQQSVSHNILKEMKRGVISAVELLALIALTSGLPAQDPQETLPRWRRQGHSLDWQCDHSVNGCWVIMTCTTNANLDSSSLVCHLDGRDFECESDESLDLSASLSFKFDANLATVNNGEYHRMAISVRGALSSQRYTLPWHFRFRVDPFYCPTLDGAGAPTTATQATTSLTTVELSTTAPQVTTMVTPVETTMTPSTQQTTTQRPSTQRPTARPTTQRPSSQSPVTRPTAPPSSFPLFPPLAICNTGRSSNGDLIISCNSDQAIRNITYEVNGVLIGTAVGQVVSISDNVFNEGQNSIELSVNYNNGQSYILLMSYEVNRLVVPVSSTERPCILNCNGRFTFADGMTVLCTVDDEPTGEGITSIVYNINNKGPNLASEIPRFHVGMEHFQSGLNNVEITVSHDVCGRASLNLEFHIPDPPEVCRISCTYRVVDGFLKFECGVDSNGQFRSVSYTVNGPPAVIIYGPVGVTRREFQIPLSQFTAGRTNTLLLTFETLCHNRIQQAEQLLPITPPPAFTVQVVSCNPSNTETIDPAFPVSVDIRADRDTVVIEATSSSQPVLFMQWSINELPSNSWVTSIVRVPKTSFRQGSNTLSLVIIGRQGSRVETTCTLDIQM